MNDIIDDIEALLAPTTKERGHLHTADVLKRAKAEILELRGQRETFLRTLSKLSSLVEIPEHLEGNDMLDWIDEQFDKTEPKQ